MIFGSRKFRTDNSTEMLSDIFGLGAISKGMSGTWELGRRLGQQYSAAKAPFQASSAFNAQRKDAIRKAYNDSANRMVDAAAQKIAKGMQNAAAALSDAALKKAVDTAREEMNSAASAAKNLSEKQEALADAQKKLITIVKSAKGPDKNVLSGLVKTNKSDLGLLGQGLALAKINQVGLAVSMGLGVVSNALGNTVRTLVPLKRTLDLGFRLFRSFNTQFNRFARMQMQITRERGEYGRRLHGSNVDYQGLMPLIGANRKAGLDDRDLLNRVVDLQSKLALERWGEGGLVDKYGRWGISVYNDEGLPKQAHELMLEMSDLLNSMSDPQERLQAAISTGYKPEDIPMLMNLRKETERFERAKADPRLRGTLEDARIFDEKGYYKEVDAATKLEEKLQEIRNQNAIDEGVGPAIKRMMEPINWLFKDWTIRERGVKEAKANAAKAAYDRGEKLTPEQLKDIEHYGDAQKRNLGDNFEHSEEFKERQRLSKELGIKFDVDQSPLERLHSALGPIMDNLSNKLVGFIDRFAGFLERDGASLVDKIADAAKTAATYAEKAYNFGVQALPLVESFAKGVLNFLKDPLGSMARNPVTTFGTVAGSVLGGPWGALAGGALGHFLEPYLSSNAVSRHADGGIVPGRKGEKGDKVLIRANPGELILNEDQQKQLAKLLHRDGRNLKGYADGGVVQPANQEASAIEDFLSEAKSYLNQDLHSGLTAEQQDKVRSEMWEGAKKGFVHGLGTGVGGVGRGIAGAYDFIGDMGESFGDWMDVWGHQ